MRTATTLVQTHKGQWRALLLPDVPVQQQKDAFRTMKGSRTHPEFATVQYQESDGTATIARFTAPEAKPTKK